MYKNKQTNRDGFLAAASFNHKLELEKHFSDLGQLIVRSSHCQSALNR